MSRNSNRSSGGNTIDNEVDRLMRQREGASQSDFARLRAKYNDAEIVDKIQAKFNEQHEEITRKAKKFASLIRQKYGSSNYPFHTLLKKAVLYKKKHNLSDAEFQEFKRIYERELVGKQNPEVLVPDTNMKKVLGDIQIDDQFNMKVSDDDFKNLKQIEALYRSSQPLHAQVMLQSMQYSDLNYESLTGQYSREHGQNPGEHVHPVIAALFLPKIDILEQHFLYSNIAGIVSARKNRKSLKTRPDYELFYSLIRDPNDVVCNADNRGSAVSDLLARANLQQQLWNSVLHLRNGQYYQTSFREFITSVDICRLNRHDNPDLIYGRYDGTVLKRLISAFSFNPTVVATTPVVQVFSTNPYNMPAVKPQVREVPMINLRLQTSVNDNSPVNLDDALEQQQLFLENGIIVPRNSSLIYSRGVLFFYVDRRASVLRVANHQPFNMGRLPTAVSGFERLNSRQVNFNTTITLLNNDVYQLRSVVVSEVNVLNQSENLVVGSSTLLIKATDANVGRLTDECFHYDPLGVVETGQDTQGNRLANDPVTQIPYGTGIASPGQSFVEMAQSRGTIFMYQLVNDESAGMISY
jgi:hypothetical protein